MTVILNAPYAVYSAGDTVNVDDATEAALVAQGRASYIVSNAGQFQPLTPAEQQTLRDGGLATLTAAQQLIAQNLTASTATAATRSSRLVTGLDQGFGPVAFTRSGTNACIVDCYGSMQFARASECRVWGANRVENRVTDSEGFVTGWTFANTPTAANIKSPNHNRPSSWTISRASGTTQLVVLNSQTYRPGKWCFSAWVLGDGATQYTIRIERSSDSAGTTQLVTPAAGALVRIAVVHEVLDTVTCRAILTVAASGAASVTVLDPQMEWVHGQSSPAPGPYVPRGVSTTILPASAYSTGAGVAGADGVRYFDYVNPWSLSSGIATLSQTPTYIDPNTTLGIAVAGAQATNQVGSSGTMTSGDWAKTATVNATAGDSTLLGKSSLWKIEQTAATQEHRIGQSWRGTIPGTLNNNAPVSLSCYARAVDAACPYVWLFIANLAGSNYYAYFNLQTGRVGTVTSGAEAWMFKEGDCYSLNLVAPSGASGSTTPVARIGVTQTDNTPSVAGTAGNGNYVTAVQFEAGLPTSYIGDSSAASTITRNEELLTATASQMTGNGWTIGADITCRYPTATALKPTWLYLIYTYANQSDRGGVGLRPGVLGGFNPGGESEIFFDFYPGISTDNANWDGIHIKSGSSTGVISGRPMDTYRYRWSMGATATQPSGSNQSGIVGSIAGTSTGNDQPRPSINSWATTPRVWTLGRQSTSIAQRGEVFVKNLYWKSSAETSTQMLAGA